MRYWIDRAKRLLEQEGALRAAIAEPADKATARARQRGEKIRQMRAPSNRRDAGKDGDEGSAGGVPPRKSASGPEKDKPEKPDGRTRGSGVVRDDAKKGTPAPPAKRKEGDRGEAPKSPRKPGDRPQPPPSPGDGDSEEEEVVRYRVVFRDAGGDVRGYLGKNMMLVRNLENAAEVEIESAKDKGEVLKVARKILKGRHPLHRFGSIRVGVEEMPPAEI